MTTIHFEPNPLVTLEYGNEVTLDVDRHTITIESVEYMANLVVEGPQGPTGPMAAGTNAAQYVHTQAMLDNIWTVEHNMNKHPVVVVEDAGGTVVHASIGYVSLSTLQVIFARSATGKAICT